MVVGTTIPRGNMFITAKKVGTNLITISESQLLKHGKLGTRIQILTYRNIIIKAAHLGNDESKSIHTIISKKITVTARPGQGQKSFCLKIWQGKDKLATPILL